VSLVLNRQAVIAEARPLTSHTRYDLSGLKIDRGMLVVVDPTEKSLKFLKSSDRFSPARQGAFFRLHGFPAIDMGGRRLAYCAQANEHSQGALADESGLKIPSCNMKSVWRKSHGLNRLSRTSLKLSAVRKRKDEPDWMDAAPNEMTFARNRVGERHPV